LAMISFGLMCLLAVAAFRVPITGSFPALLLAALLFTAGSTGMGLLASTATRSQGAAMFLTIVATLIPAGDFSGLVYPVSSLGAAGRAVGTIYPASYMFTISRAIFNKAMGLGGVREALGPLVIFALVIFACSVALLKKQES